MTTYNAARRPGGPPGRRTGDRSAGAAPSWNDELEQARAEIERLQKELRIVQSQYQRAEDLCRKQESALAEVAARAAQFSKGMMTAQDERDALWDEVVPVMKRQAIHIADLQAECERLREWQERAMELTQQARKKCGGALSLDWHSRADTLAAARGKA